MNRIESILEQLRKEFPQAQVNYEEDTLQVRFATTHISTEKLSKIEQILFYRGKLISNSKELIKVENGTVFVNMKFWTIFTRVYEFLQEQQITSVAADISSDMVVFSITDYLNAKQLDGIQAIINEELGINLSEHDSIRVFGHNSYKMMYIRCNRR